MINQLGPYTNSDPMINQPTLSTELKLIAFYMVFYLQLKLITFLWCLSTVEVNYILYRVLSTVQSQLHFRWCFI